MQQLMQIINFAKHHLHTIYFEAALLNGIQTAALAHLQQISIHSFLIIPYGN
jgi:hypothetical protein